MIVVKKFDVKPGMAKVQSDSDRNEQAQFAGVMGKTKEIAIVSGNSVKVKETKVETGLYLDDLYMDNPEDTRGFPMNDCYIISGNMNTGKSYCTAKIARAMAEKLKKRILWIASESRGVKDSPDFKAAKDLFDFVYPKDLAELSKFIVERAGQMVGRTHCVIVIDSITALVEDSEYMPTGAKNMLTPLRERALLIRQINDAMRDWLAEATNGERGELAIIITTHLKKITRPDSARPEEVLMPIYGGGKLQSGYTLSGVVPDIFQYLASYILVFMDYTAETFKDSELATQKVPTVIRVYPHKSRVTSRYVYKTFRINDTGVVQ